MLLDVLQSRISFVLLISVPLSMNFTLFTAETNRAKLKFENVRHTKKVNTRKLESRDGDARIDVVKVLAIPLKAFSIAITIRKQGKEGAWTN